MRVESLIGIIIFVIYLAWVFRKKRRRLSGSTRPDAAESRPGWKARLDTYLARMKQELEAENKESPGVNTVWEELMQEEEDAPAPASERIEPVMEKVFSSAVPPVTETAAADDTLAATVQKKSSKGFSYKKEDLRKAVIWSEILAPPLALRDD